MVQCACGLLHPTALEVSQHGNGSVALDWKSGKGAGKTVAYDVQRRELPDGTWTHICTSIPPEITLTDQPQSKVLEYRVLAFNRTGYSEPSNTVETNC